MSKWPCLAAVALMCACASRAPATSTAPAVKAPGALPVRTAEQLAEDARARAACAEACTGATDDRTACVQRCLVAHPIEQVEVVPAAPAPAAHPQEAP